MMFHAVLYMVSVALGALCLATWLEPTITDWVTMHLRARSAGVRARRAAYRAAYDAALIEGRTQG